MSEIIVLDTHIWLWLINSNFDQFPLSWLERFELAEILAISTLSCYEIALAQSRGRLELTCSSEEWFSRALTPAKIELLPLTPKITVRAKPISHSQRSLRSPNHRYCFRICSKTCQC